MDVSISAFRLSTVFGVASTYCLVHNKYIIITTTLLDYTVYNCCMKLLAYCSLSHSMLFQIHCEVRVMYSGGQSPSPWTQSNVFYAGIEARPEILQVSEWHPLSDPKQITVYSTVPIVCGQNVTHPHKTCALDLDSGFANFVDQTDVLTDWCSVTIEGGTNVSQPLGVSAVRDGVDDGVREHDVVISTKYVVSRTPLEWVGHPPVIVKVLTESIPSPDCYSVTYGHYKTFDGW